MPFDSFLRRKTSVLSKIDKSYIGEWDKKIISLCNKINSNKNYYTTSSCSGRVVLMIDQNKKSHNLFLKISHELISFNWLKNNLNKIKNKFDSVRSFGFLPKFGNSKKLKGEHFRETNLFLLKTSGSASGVFDDSRSLSGNFKNSKLQIKNNSGQSKKLKTKLIKLKCEPPILHVVCRNLESASLLLEKAKSSGMKHSGIHCLGRNITLEIHSDDRLEFPIFNKNKILVDDNFLKLVAKESNKKLKKSWKMIENLSEKF